VASTPPVLASKLAWFDEGAVASLGMVNGRLGSAMNGRSTSRHESSTNRTFDDGPCY
jgi:hypothetical protein